MNSHPGLEKIYFPYLDSLRCIAVFLVLLHHWFPRNNWWNGFTGAFGVAIFFVLSGFLITRILISEKRKNNELTESPSLSSVLIILKKFYIKRSLRIFPIYYVTVIFLFCLSLFFIFDLKGSFISYLLYFQNFYFFFTKDCGGALSHTWSLAVEEQFYLVWPLMLLLVKKKWEYTLIFIVCIFDIVAGYLLEQRFVEFIPLLPISCFSSFMLGAFLAKNHFENGKISNYGFLACLIITLTSIIFSDMIHIHRISWAAIAILPVYYAISPKSDFLKKHILSNKVLIYFGKISYGIYLFHYPVYNIWPIIKNKTYHYINLPINNNLIDAFFFSFITLTLAHFSWKLFEIKFISYKEKLYK